MINTARKACLGLATPSELAARLYPGADETSAQQRNKLVKMLNSGLASFALNYKRAKASCAAGQGDDLAELKQHVRTVSPIDLSLLY